MRKYIDVVLEPTGEFVKFENQDGIDLPVDAFSTSDTPEGTAYRIFLGEPLSAFEDLKTRCEAQIKEIRKEKSEWYQKQINDAREDVVQFHLALRDQFAMAVMTGLLAGGYQQVIEGSHTWRAEFCFNQVDAMLKVRAG